MERKRCALRHISRSATDCRVKPRPATFWRALLPATFSHALLPAGTNGHGEVWSGDGQADGARRHGPVPGLPGPQGPPCPGLRPLRVAATTADCARSGNVHVLQSVHGCPARARVLGLRQVQGRRRKVLQRLAERKEVVRVYTDRRGRRRVCGGRGLKATQRYPIGPALS